MKQDFKVKVSCEDNKRSAQLVSQLQDMVKDRIINTFQLLEIDIDLAGNTYRLFQIDGIKRVNIAKLKWYGIEVVV